MLQTFVTVKRHDSAQDPDRQHCSKLRTPRALARGESIQMTIDLTAFHHKRHLTHLRDALDGVAAHGH